MIKKEHVIATLDNEDEAFRFLAQTPVQRSFVNRRTLTHKAADVLREVLANGHIPRDLENEGIRTCYEQGWLHSEPLDFDAMEIICVFPTRLHAK